MIYQVKKIVPQSIYASRMAFELIHYVKVLNPVSVAVYAPDLSGTTSRVFKLPPKETFG